MTGTRRQLAEHLRAAAEALMARDHSPDSLARATQAAELVHSTLSGGEDVGVEIRTDRFIDQMLHRGPVEDGARFEPFEESPVSGSQNPRSAQHIEIVRRGDTVRADVVIGVAMEGAPGRGHGGITAALFDDVMGALQVVIGKSGYTRSLRIDYFAPFPVHEPVLFEVVEVPSEPGLFAIDGIATSGGRTIAKAHGIFTIIDKARFARH